MNPITSRDAAVDSRPTIVPPPWRLLAETSGRLDSSLDYQDTLTNVVQSVLPRIADYAVLVLTAPNGTVTRELAAHRHPERANLLARLGAFWTDLSTTNPWLTEMLRTTEPQLIPSVDHAFLESTDPDEALRATLRELGLLSLLVLPLVARQRRFGCLILATTHDSHRRYAHRDVTIANEMARRAAHAIDRALLYRASEQAARAREDMMAIVSHDLKNPLATIQMAVQFLLEEIGPNDRAHETERAQLKVIHRSAQRMYRLVHDLLDAAAFEAGQFHVAPTLIPVETLVNDALELLRPLAAAKASG